MSKYFCFIIFHFSSTLQFDLIIENELFAFTIFLIGISDSVLDQIGFRTLCRNELSSKIEVSLHIFCIRAYLLNEDLTYSKRVAPDDGD